MEDDIFLCFNLMVQLLWFNLFYKKSTKPLGPSLRCKPNLNQEEGLCAKEWICSKNQYMPQKGIFEKKSKLIIHLSSFGFTSLHFLISFNFTLNFNKHGCNEGEEETHFAIRFMMFLSMLVKHVMDNQTFFCKENGRSLQFRVWFVRVWGIDRVCSQERMYGF